MSPVWRRFLFFRPMVLSGLLGLCLLATGCGSETDTLEATPADVDESTPVEITEEERARFSPPRDSTLTEEQVTKYLKTSLLQFDLVRKHSERLHERVAEMEKRGEKGGALAGLRNLMDAGQTMLEFGDVIGGSYIRSARTLGYNPAELEWIQERMVDVAGYLALKPMHEAAAQSAGEMRAHVEMLREQLAASDGNTLGYTEEEIDQMLKTADEMESGSFLSDAPPSVRHNVEVLHRARPAVTDNMWAAIGMTGGAMGLMALSGLADPNDAEAQQKLDEYRQLYTDALENRVSAGMEDSAAGAEAALQEE